MRRRLQTGNRWLACPAARQASSFVAHGTGSYRAGSWEQAWICRVARCVQTSATVLSVRRRTQQWEDAGPLTPGEGQ